MKKRLIYLLIFLFVLISVSGFFWFYEAQFLTGHAETSRTQFSVDNSYVFMNPLRARANNMEKIRVTVFVLNNQGLGVLGKRVTFGQDKSLTMETLQGLSDDFGKAVIDIRAQKPGNYYLTVNIDGVSLPQKIRLNFD